MQKKLTEHAPVVNWRNRHIIVSIVGCGGTGSHIATGMPYLHQALLAAGHPYGLRVFLIDGDRITETNCVRQPFSRSEVGLYKAVVLINRLNLFWGLDWEAVPHFVHCGQDVPDSDFLISCVDTRAARAAIARGLVSNRGAVITGWIPGISPIGASLCSANPCGGIARIAQNGYRACMNSFPPSFTVRRINEIDCRHAAPQRPWIDSYISDGVYVYDTGCGFTGIAYTCKRRNCMRMLKVAFNRGSSGRRGPRS